MKIRSVADDVVIGDDAPNFFLSDCPQWQDLAHRFSGSAQRSWPSSAALSPTLVMFRDLAVIIPISCHECASSLLPNDCLLQRLAFQMRSSGVEVDPCWVNASLFLSFSSR